MAEFAHSEPDLASQQRYLPLVSMGSPLGWWSGSCIFANCEVTSLYMGILTLRLCHFEPRSCRWPKVGWESLQTNTTAATALEFHTIKALGRIYGDITPVCSLPAFYFTVGIDPSPHTAKQRPGGCHGPPRFWFVLGF